MLMMFPFEAPTIFEGIHKSYFRMPRVVKDQKNKFENDDFFRQLSHESAVKYTGFKDRPLEERQMKFVANCQEGHTEVSVVQSGIQFTLMFNPTANPAYNNEGCDFNKELGKVHIKAGFILNGVCVLWRGWVDLQRLEGFGCLEFDEYRAYLEDAMLKQQLDKQQQQACNNSSNRNSINTNHLNQHQTSPLGGGGHNPHHHNPLDSLRLGSSAAAAAAAAAISVGLNPACLGGGPPAPALGANPPHNSLGQNQASPAAAALPPHTQQLAVQPTCQQASMHTHATSQQQQAPQAPVTLADTSSYYGNAAIAAAAAAAFHQAFSIGGVGGMANGILQPPSSQQQQQSHHHHHQAVRNLTQRFTGQGGGMATVAAGGGGGPTMQAAPKMELQ